MGVRIFTLSKLPLDHSLHLYLNGVYASPDTYTVVAPGEYRFEGVSIGDRLEARFVYEQPSGKTPGAHPLSSDLGDYHPGLAGGPCSGNLPLYRPTADVPTTGGVFGHDGYYNRSLDPSEASTVLPQRDLGVRNVDWGAAGGQTFQWIDRHGSGFIGYLLAHWLYPPTGCIYETDVVSGSLGGHGVWNGSSYDYPDSAWVTNTANPPAAGTNSFPSDGNSSLLKLCRISTAPGGGGINPPEWSGRAAPYAYRGARV